MHTDSINRVLSSGISDFFVERKVICEFPNDPTTGPRLFASNSIRGIICENQLDANMETNTGDPVMVNLQDVMDDDDGSGSCFIALSKNDTFTIITEGRLSTSIIGISGIAIIVQVHACT